MCPNYLARGKAACSFPSSHKVISICSLIAHRDNFNTTHSKLTGLLFGQMVSLLYAHKVEPTPLTSANSADLVWQCQKKLNSPAIVDSYSYFLFSWLKNILDSSVGIVSRLRITEDLGFNSRQGLEFLLNHKALNQL